MEEVLSPQSCHIALRLDTALIETLGLELTVESVIAAIIARSGKLKLKHQVRRPTIVLHLLSALSRVVPPLSRGG